MQSLNIAWDIVWVPLLVLFTGDLISTFAYHVPEHVFGRFHALIHHSDHRSFIRYAWTHQKPQVLLSGFLAFFAYIALVPCFWQLSPLGSLLGLILGEIHVRWRHAYDWGWRTPAWLQQCCWSLQLSTPERHKQHHRNGRQAFGDIFIFFDPPAQIWYRFLLTQKRRWRRIRHQPPIQNPVV